MKKQLLFILLYSVNICSNEIKQTKKNQSLHSLVLDKIANDVRSSWPKTGTKLALEYRKTDEAYRQLGEYLVEIKESDKALRMGTQVLEKVEEYLSKPEAKSHPEIRKAQAAVKAAKVEHQRAMNELANAKKAFENGQEQLKRSMNKLKDSIENKVDKKSKLAIEIAHPVLQDLKPEEIKPIDSMKTFIE